jgi:hypothetical protein
MPMPQKKTELKEAIREKWDESSQSYDSFHGHGIKSDEERDAWRQALQRALGKGHLCLQPSCAPHQAYGASSAASIHLHSQALELPYRWSFGIIPL